MSDQVLMEELRSIPEPKSGPVENTVWGDADGDGTVMMNDVVLIMQSIANADKYGINGTDEKHITEKGSDAANVHDRAAGLLTVQDALEVQRLLLELIPAFEF